MDKEAMTVQNFKAIPTDIPEVIIIENFCTGDQRGRFTKCFEKGIYEGFGISFQLSESFLSVSSKNVIRGLHFQLHEPQAKLVCVPAGRVMDYAVDIRPESPSFGKWVCAELSAENARALYIPRGFAHGFCSLEDNSIMLYQCDGKYDKESDTGIIFNDKDIGIKWPVDLSVSVHSERDLKLMSFSEYCRQPVKLCL